MMPNMDGIDAATQIYHKTLMPVILVSAYHDADFIRRAEADHIMAHLVKPIKQADLEPAIALAMRRFEQFQALGKETEDPLGDRRPLDVMQGDLLDGAVHRQAILPRGDEQIDTFHQAVLVDLIMMEQSTCAAPC